MFDRTRGVARLVDRMADPAAEGSTPSRRTALMNVATDAAIEENVMDEVTPERKAATPSTEGLQALAAFAAGSQNFETLIAREDFEVNGDVNRLRDLVDRLDVFEFGFEIVLP